jgi:FKBP-type peptidyl-prolyl cis-trans isomerase
MKNRLLIGWLLPLLVSCTGQSLQQIYDAQEKKIDAFVAAQAKDDKRVEYNGGSVRVVLTEGTSEQVLSPSGTVSFYYAGYVLSGSSVSRNNLFATNSKDIADAAGWTLSDESIYAVTTVSLDEKDLLKGLRNGLVGVKEGEECLIVFSGKYGYGKKAAGTIPPKSALVYQIWVESISND